MPNVWNSSIANLEHFTSVGIPWETISFEVCPGTGYPKEPPWDRPTPIDCILVVNHGRGCIVVVNSDRTLSPLLPFLGTLGPIVCSGPTWDPRGLSGARRELERDWCVLFIIRQGIAKSQLRRKSLVPIWKFDKKFLQDLVWKNLIKFLNWAIFV